MALFNRKKRGGVLTVHYADTHPNSVTGLCPKAGFVREDGSTHDPNLLQAQYWDWWFEVWEEAKLRKKELGAREIYAFQHGDGCDDNTHSSTGLISTLRNDIIRLGVQVQEPVVRTADKLAIMRGTPSHVGQGGYLEESIAMIQACRYRRSAVGKDTQDRMEQRLEAWDMTSTHNCEIVIQETAERQVFTHWHLLTDVEDVLMSGAHRAKSYSRTQRTRGAGAARSSVELALSLAKRKDVMAYKHRLAFRAHGHYTADSGRASPYWRMFYCPPWQGMTDYGHQIGEVEIDGPGVWFVYCKDGGYQEDLLQFEFDADPILKL